MNKFFFALIIFIAVFPEGGYAQKKIFIKQNAIGNNNGTSWANAFTSFQNALANANPGDTLWVAQGNYKPTSGTDRKQSFFLKNDLIVLGGFAGNENSLSLRDWRGYPTILSGNIGNLNDSTDNSFNIMRSDTNVVIDGFFFEWGNADSSCASSGIYDMGGAINNYKVKNVTIRNCVFRHNTARGGGAISGYFNSSHKIFISDCEFYNNFAQNGGAIGTWDAAIQISHCVFRHNFCRNFFQLQTSDSMSVWGGAIFTWGALSISHINQCTFFHNSSKQGGAFHNRSGIPTIQNSIFLNNSVYGTSANGPDAYASSGAIDTFRYCLSYQTDLKTKTGCFSQNPLFLDTLRNDFRLSKNSPCINAGYPSGIKDPDGTVADIGAICYPKEFNYTIGISGATFSSFASALDSIRKHTFPARIVVRVKSGTYNEQLNIEYLNYLKNNGEVRLIFESETGNPNDVILTYNAGSIDNYTLCLNGARKVFFRNLTLKATNSTYGRVIHLKNDTKYNCFENCNLSGLTELIYVERSFSDTIRNCTFSGGTKGIATPTSSSSTQISGVRIYGNTFKNHSSDCIYIYGSCADISIEKNTFSGNNTASAIYFYQIIPSTGITNIQYNKTGGTFSTGFNLNALSDVEWRIGNNHFYGTIPLGIIFNDNWFGDRYASLKLFHNSIQIKSSNYLLRLKSAKRLELYNNILVNLSSSGRVAEFGTDVLVSDYNCYFNPGTSSNFINSTSNLKDWITQSHTDSSSIFVNPYFFPDTSYFFLNPAINNKGKFISIAGKDIEGHTRNYTPDMGAYDYEPCSGPLSGTKTLGTTGDFKTFNHLVGKLLACGINGPLTVNVQTGTYNEQVEFPSIQGASSLNTITIQSASADSSSVALQYAPLDDFAYNTHYVLKLNDAHYYKIKGITIKNLSTGFNTGVVIDIRNKSSHNIFSGNRIIGNGGNAMASVLFSADTNNYNKLSGNLILNGRIGILLQGMDTILAKSNLVSGNIFKYQFTNAIKINNNLYPSITDNKITQNNSPNNFSSIHLVKAIGSLSQPVIVANNMIYGYTAGNSAVGLHLESCQDVNICFNTIHIKAGNLGKGVILGGKNLQLKNNIFRIAQPGYCVYTAASSEFTSDYNLFHNTWGTSGIFGYYKDQSVNFDKWRDSTQGDKHSFFHLTEFTNDSTLNTQDPFANYMGIPIPGIIKDIEGQGRDPQHPDVGADEFSGSTALGGIYTIGPAPSDFNSFSTAVNALKSGGVIDSVIFRVKPGNYSEQIKLTEIIRASSRNTIAFESLSKDSSSVNISWSANDSSAFVVQLDGADFLRFRYLTLEAKDSSFGRVFSFRNGACNNLIRNCRIIGKGSTRANIHSVDGIDNNNLFANNRIELGGYGIQMMGESTTKESGTRIIQNVFLNQTKNPINLTYQSDPFIYGNKIIRNSPIRSDFAGIFLDASSGKNYPEISIIANNTILMNSNYISAGILMRNSTGFGFYHNSVHIYGNTANSRCFDLQGNNMYYLTNNILSNVSGGLAIYRTDSWNAFDQNNYFCTGSTLVNGITNILSLDANAQTYSPLFPIDGDLVPSSPWLFNSGKKLSSVLSDIQGISRSESPSMGAYEYTPCSLSGNYTIGTTGDFKSLREAVGKFQTCRLAGPVVFNITNGTYKERIVIPEIAGRSSLNTLTIQSAAQDSSKVVLEYGSTKADSNYVVKILNTSYITLRHLTLKPAGPLGRALDISSSTEIHIENNYFSGIATDSVNNRHALIFFSKNNNPSIDSLIWISTNRIENGAFGIHSEYAPGLFIDNNSFKQQTVSAIKVNAPFKSISSNRIQNDNIIKSYKAIAAETFQGGLIARNRIFLDAKNQECIGIFSGTKIQNNFIAIKTFAEKEVHGINTNSNPEWVYFNSVLISGNNTKSKAYYKPYSWNGSDVRNNSFVNLAHGLAASGDFNAVDTKYDFNNYFSNGDKLIQNTNSIYGGIFANLPAFKLKSGTDSSSVSLNPAYTSESDLYSAALLLNANGIPIQGITSDIDGELRDLQQPDIGADESSLPAIFSLGIPDQFACGNMEYILNAGYGYTSYLWSNGSDSSSTKFKPKAIPGYIEPLICTVTYKGQSYRDTVIFTSRVVQASAGDDITVCTYDSLHLQGSGGTKYTWYRTDDSQILGQNKVLKIDPFTGDHFSLALKVEDENGCFAFDTVMANSVIKPPTPEIRKKNPNELQALVNNLPGTTEYHYSWYFNNQKLNINSSVLSVSNPGKYIVLIYQGQCFSDSSSSYGLGIQYTNISDYIKLYPNPATDLLCMEFLNSIKFKAYDICDLDGKIIIQNKIYPVSGMIHTIPIGSLPRGMFFLRIQSDEEMYLYRFIKQ